MLAVLLSREKGLASERQGGRWRQVPRIVTRTRSENGQKGRINYGASLGWGLQIHQQTEMSVQISPRGERVERVE
jgi:hypothetical protein